MVEQPFSKTSLFPFKFYGNSVVVVTVVLAICSKRLLFLLAA